MTALDDAERTAPFQRAGSDAGHRNAAGDRSVPVRLPATTDHGPVAARTGRGWLPSPRFLAAVVAIGGMQLLATMDSTIAIVALPKIQAELGLSDAGRSWVITAYVLTFGGLMLLGGRLGDTIGRKRTFIVGVDTVHHRLGAVRNCLGRNDSGCRPAAAGRRRGDRLPDRSGTGRDHVRQGAGAQRRHRGVRRDDRHRLGDGPGGRRCAGRGVLAAGVPGQRADRPAGDLPGAHHSAGDPP